MSETKHTPGPWTVGPYAMDVNGPSEKGGSFKVCDIRGWGYYTGKGHGALGLSAEEGIFRQTANARLIAASPDLLKALTDFVELGPFDAEDDAKLHAQIIEQAKAAIRKATEG